MPIALSGQKACFPATTEKSEIRVWADLYKAAFAYSVSPQDPSRGEEPDKLVGVGALEVVPFNTTCESRTTEIGPKPA